MLKEINPREIWGGGLRLEFYGVSVWIDILQEFFWVNNWISKIRDGTRVRFWVDPWCGNFALKFSFSSLYDLAAKKSETVAEVWDQLVGNVSWNLKFLSLHTNWEVDLVVHMQSVLQLERVALDGWIKLLSLLFSQLRIFGYFVFHLKWCFVLGRQLVPEF